MSSQANTKAIAGGIVVVLAIGAGVVWFDQTRDVPGATDVALVIDDADGGMTEAVSAIDDPAGEGGVVESDDVADVEVVSVVPSFDTFFRNPDETTIIAGRAAPGQTVAILLGGEELDRTVADPDGTFGAVVFIVAADQPRRLTLLGDPDGEALASAESIIVPPSEAVVVADATPDTQPEETVVEEQVADVGSDEDAVQEDAAALAEDDVVAEAAEQTIALSADPEPTTQPLAAPTLIADADGVRVIQPAPTTPDLPVFQDNVALDTITYDPAGEVVLAGRAVAGGFVQVYLNNQPVMTSRISDAGNWQIDLPDVDTGVYTLRVDEIDAEGNVQSRVETPFKREERADVVAILAEETSAEGFDIAVKTVQPGATLWAIAEETFGDGIMYVNVFEANRDLIRDPDLIYPGQVFRLPEMPE